MGIMLIQNLIGKLHHLHASNSKTFLFEPADYLTDKSTLYRAGFEQY